MEYNLTINHFSVGETVQGYYLAKEISYKTGKNDNKYVDIMLSDKTGEISAKYWDYIVGMESEYHSSVILKVRGVVNEWKGQLQLRIERMRPVSDSDGVNIEDFVQSAPIPCNEMLDTIYDYIKNIKTPNIKIIVNSMINSKKDQLLYYPAAKSNHHSVRGGLLYHMVTMLKAAENMLKIYPYLNADLLYAGVILHDLSKTDEMLSNSMGIVQEYKPKGRLLNHLVLGTVEIEKHANIHNIKGEVVMLLQHMVLAHHYHPEYGSPVKPMFAEAEMLHYLDIIDARMYDIKKASEMVEPGNFSDSIFSLEGRRIYNLPDNL